MKIAILSDTHDNLPNFKKAIDWIKKEKIKTIIHCGDVCNQNTLKEILDNFSGKIHLVFGNVDYDYLTKLKQKKFSDLIFYGEWGKVMVGGKRIAFVHFPELARELAQSKKYDLVFYGHTHKPWEEKIGKCRLVNPGNLANLFYKATFAVYDTNEDKLELKILEKMK